MSSNSTFEQIMALLPSLLPEEQEKLKRLLTDNPKITLQDLVEIKENQGVVCPECGEVKSVVKYGFNSKGVQRYHCTDCNVTFTPLSYTFLANTKKDIQTWLEYVQCLIDGLSIRKAAERCRITIRTAFFWRHKLLDMLRQKLKRIKLHDIVEADDTFFRESFKGNEPVGRDPYKRGTPASSPGLSKEQICVSTAIDRNGKVYGKISARGHASAKEIKKAIGSRIDKEAILCTDSDRAYSKFARDKHLEHIVINDHESVNGVYNIQHINSFHSRLKNFIRRFHGVSTKYLNNYLAWINSICERKLSLVQVIKASIKEDYWKRWFEVKGRKLMPV